MNTGASNFSSFFLVIAFLTAHLQDLDLAWQQEKPFEMLACLLSVSIKLLP